MAIDLQKLEQKFNALLDDPNFATDFEQWLVARNVSQNSSKPFVERSAGQIENCYWFRHFLMCNKIAQNLCKSGGGNDANFALYIKQEEAGQIFNSQMTFYFWAADKTICQITESEEGEVFEMLEDENEISICQLSQLTGKELSEYFESYIVGKLSL